MIEYTVDRYNGGWAVFDKRDNQRPVATTNHVEMADDIVEGLYVLQILKRFAAQQQPVT